jgi:hypothetical protein
MIYIIYYIYHMISNHIIISNVIIVSIFVPQEPYLTCLGEPWHRVYANNEEPYAPVEECTACGLRWLAKQATHTDPKCTHLGGKYPEIRNPDTL